MADEAHERIPDVVGTNFGIAEEVTEKIKGQAKQFVEMVESTVLSAWQLGKDLVEAKKRVRHGYWIPWVETRVGLEPRTAQRLMQLYERDRKKEFVENFSSTSEALRQLPPRKSKSAVAGRGKRKATKKRRVNTGPGLAEMVAGLEALLQEMPASESSHSESDLQALVKLAAVSAETIAAYASVSTEDDGGAVVEATKEALGKIRDALGMLGDPQEEKPGQLALNTEDG